MPVGQSVLFRKKRIVPLLLAFYICDVIKLILCISILPLLFYISEHL